MKNAEEGLEALKREKVDIIIVDYCLPGMDGMEFLKLSSSACPNTVNLPITAYDDDITSEVFKIVFHDFVRKPFSLEKLIGSLALLIESREENRTRYVAGFDARRLQKGG